MLGKEHLQKIDKLGADKDGCNVFQLDQHNPQSFREDVGR